MTNEVFYVMINRTLVCILGRLKMAISYKPLWHLLVEKEMNKEDLKRASKITSNIVSRMTKNTYVSLDSLEKICLALDCRIEDVVEIIKD